VAQMRARRGRVRQEELCSGPGKLTQALAIELSENATSLASGPVRIRPRPPELKVPEIVHGTRIGITRAAELPWRFCLAGSRHVSRPRPRPQLSRAS
jgi:DNA-3-methyladenine glycosylase